MGTGENEDIRRDFIEAFTYLYAPNGMKGVSVGSLCAKAGYSRSTFYRTFDSLDDVLMQLEDEALPAQTMQLLLENRDRIGMREITDLFLGSLYAERELFHILLLHDDGRFFNKIKNCMKPVFRSQAERVYVMTDFEYDVFAEYLTVAKLTLLRMWAVSPVELSLGHMTQVTDSTLEGGFWDRVEQACQCSREGRPYQRVTIEELGLDRPWVAFRQGVEARAMEDDFPDKLIMDMTKAPFVSER